MSKAYRQTTPTRERICVNGLWRWQPANNETDAVPTGDWGHLRVPEAWPRRNHDRSGPQLYFPNPNWVTQDASGATSAWYEREITVPQEWTGRCITLWVGYLNSYAVVYLDCAKVGEMRFPGGEVDLTGICRPGQKQVLSMLVTAMPLKAVMMSYSDSAAARQVAGDVERRGLCGDVYLASTPPGARISDVKVETSVRNWEITFELGLESLEVDGTYSVRARIIGAGGSEPAKEFASQPFQLDELASGRIRITENWRPERLWDTNTPQNQFDVTVSLVDSTGRVVDTALPVRSGFREFWIEGKDFYLNGTRLYLAAIPLDNAQGSAITASYEATRATLQWYKSFGINFVYTHNYGCEPGTHRAFEEVLRAADDEGVLVSFSQPHFGQYTWTTPDAENANGYAQHAAFYVHVAQNHPSVVCYSTSHNGTGYGEDMNPDMIDGVLAPRDRWSVINTGHALRAEAILRQLDRSRFVYHHAGNLGSMDAMNFYGNWIPPQEMSDWFEHWATFGVKPVFPCEYSVPLLWDWSMYRGWYKGKRAFGDAVVPWEFCMAEWNAQTLGAAAYQIGEAEKENLRWEAEQFRLSRVWRRWDYPHPFGSPVFEDVFRVVAAQVTDNYRAMRTWGTSATSSPWDTQQYWIRSSRAIDSDNLKLEVDWQRSQRPGSRPVFVDETEARDVLKYRAEDFKPTVVADALRRNYMPQLAYIGGKPEAFTSKDHNFFAGETAEKQLILINNSRVEVTASCEWTFNTSQPMSGRLTVSLPPGDQQRVPIKLELPEDLTARQYSVQANVDFTSGEQQKDSLAIDVLPRTTTTQTAAKVALFDPKGQTGKLLDRIRIQWQSVEAIDNVSEFDVLIIGKGALNLQNAAPNMAAVREGLKVIVFEQTGEVLEKRFGFRIAEYGLRWVFKRVPDHPVLTEIADEHLRNWRGASTTLPHRLSYELAPEFSGSPSVKWAGLTVTRVWRCGNRGNVASALIEKPACGDFLPLLDGGYGLQYTSLLQHRAGKGMVLFCQTDVTGRTETDPAADTLARNIVQYASTWKPSPMRTIVYAGSAAGETHLVSAGFRLTVYDGEELSAGDLLVVGSGGGTKLAGRRAELAQWVKAGGHVVALGLDQAEANSFLPVNVSMSRREHIAAYFEPFSADSPLAGVSPAEVHNRDPRFLPLISEGATVVGDGVLATACNGQVIFCQMVPWQFDYSGEKMNLKRTYRRASCLVARLLGNLRAAGETPILEHMSTPVEESEERWSTGLYLDKPEEWDDPFRFFRW